MPRKHGSKAPVSPEAAKLEAGDFVYRASFWSLPDMPEEFIYVRREQIRRGGEKTLFIAGEQIWRNELRLHDWHLAEADAVAVLRRRAADALESGKRAIQRATWELAKIAEWKPTPRKEKP